MLKFIKSIKNMTIKDNIVNFLLYIRFFILIRLGYGQRKSSKNKLGYDLTFIDEFNDISWDYDGFNNKWKVGEVFGLYHPDKDNVYYNEPEIVKINNNSYARFKVEYKPKVFDNRLIPFAVSLLSTERSFSQQYGRFECRMNLPKEKGTWPAFWLWGPTWPPEIDIIEAYGKKTGRTVKTQRSSIWFRKNGKPDNLGSRAIELQDTDFHEFAMEWTQKSIKFYTDGILALQYTNRKKLDGTYNKPNINMWMVLNHSVQERYVNRKESNYYSEFLVDYVRAYNKI